MHKALLPLLCLVIFHSPDGREIRIDTLHVTAIRPAEAVKQHLAEGTRTIIYASGQNFGVIEPVAEVDLMMKNCIEE
jgi:hypothetical protein